MVPLPSDLAGLPAWGFAFPGPLRDKLTALALAGTKTTTAGLYVEVELGDDAMSVPGMREVLLDSNERPVAVIETVECHVSRLADVDDRHAIDEGEGYANTHEFRVAHERFWNGYLDALRTTRQSTVSMTATGRSSESSRTSRVPGTGSASPSASISASRPAVVVFVPANARAVSSSRRSPGKAKPHAGSAARSWRSGM